jgi:DNA polymerase-4
LFVETLEIDRFHGIGKVTAQKMHKMGIFTGKDLREYDEAFLVKHFGKIGRYYYQIARGIDTRIVNPERIRKSVGSENTFMQDLEARAEIQLGLEPLIEDVWRYCTKHEIFGRTVSLKVKYNDFQIVTRSRTTLSPIFDLSLFERIAYELLDQIMPPSKGIRLLGIALSNLSNEQDMEGKQLTLEF